MPKQVRVAACMQTQGSRHRESASASVLLVVGAPLLSIEGGFETRWAFVTNASLQTEDDAGRWSSTPHSAKLSEAGKGDARERGVGLKMQGVG